MAKAPPIPIEERKAFPIAARREIAERQADAARNVFCACGCGRMIARLGLTKTGLVDIIKTAPFEWDHITARALGGFTTAENGRALAKPCHDAAKTPLDRKRIDKAKSQARETGQQKRLAERKAKGQGSRLRSNPKMQSRGFPKHIRRLMNGNVVEARP